MNGTELLDGLAELVTVFEANAAMESAVAEADETAGRGGDATTAYHRAGVWRSAAEYVGALLIRARTDGWSLDWRQAAPESPPAAPDAVGAPITPADDSDDRGASALAGAIGVVVDVIGDMIRRGRPTRG